MLLESPLTGELLPAFRLFEGQANRGQAPRLRIAHAASGWKLIASSGSNPSPCLR